MNLQEQLEKAQMDLLAEKANGQQKDQDKINELEALEASLLKQIMDEQNQQAHEGRVQEATTESSSFLGDIEIAGVAIAESGLSELAYNILNAKVQAKHVAAIEKLSLAMNEQQARLQADLKNAVDRANQLATSLDEYMNQNKDLEVANYQLGLEKDELDDKARKGAELLYEATETIEKLNKQIDEYKKAELLAPQPTVTLSTSEQVAKQEAELKASRIKVTSMTVDPNDFAKRTWTIVLALTGEKKEINYLEKGNYTLVDEATAEQLRADEADKKAEQEALQAAIPTLEAPEVQPVNAVLETVEASGMQPFPEGNQVDANANGENTETAGNGHTDEVVGRSEQEGQIEIEARFKRIEEHLGLKIWNADVYIDRDEQAVA